MNGLDTKVAIVTGAGSGIGKATVQRLAKEGVKVAVVDKNTDAAAEVTALVVAGGHEAIAIAADVSDEAQVHSMVEETVRVYGGLDILHNNAALVAPEFHARDRMITDMEVAVWDRTFAVNLRGTMLGCKHAIPYMLARGGGSIINTSSVHAVQNNLRLPAYSASKAAIISLTRSVAIQYGKQRIRCNALVLGLIVTERSRKVLSADALRLMEEHYLTPYVGDPAHVAGVVAFLASADAEFVTGHAMVVDGGLSAHVADLADRRRAD
jgi:NAD(P)-dependent dehydrogenase (short-subunit alcohol dehydrogenase family)